MRILITNDDGINAPGLKVLEAIAAELAGPDGEVWVVAPAFEQSGVGHTISYTHPMLLAEFGPRRFALEGSPADCMIAGLHRVLPENTPDLILSGVNRGNNCAESVVYSGTVGAAMEAALQGYKAIALSQYYGPRNRDLDDPFEAARVHGAAVIRDLLAHGIWDDMPYRPFYNVNFPPVPADAVEGRRIAPQGSRGDWRYGVEPYVAPNGRTFLWIRGGGQSEAVEDGADVNVNLDGHIAITPLRADLTAHETLDTLRSRLDT